MLTFHIKASILISFCIYIEVYRYQMKSEQLKIVSKANLSIDRVHRE